MNAGRRELRLDPATPGSDWKPWALELEAVFEGLTTNPEQGLSEVEVKRRLARFGSNRLRRIQHRSGWRMLWDQFASLIVALLAAAAALAFVFGERVEGLAILGVIGINAAIGFVTERRAVRSMESLRRLGHADSTVRRGGIVQKVSASLLVPGDIVVLDAGDVLTADVRLIAGSRIQVDESPLTGESLPVDKDPAPVVSDASLSDRRCMLFKGTAVTRGSGEGVVVSTGMTTELGRISSLVETAEPETTPLEKRLDRLARRLIGFTVIVAAAVAVIVVVSGRSLLFAAEIAIALAVATIPEGLPIVATVALARGMWRMVRRNAVVEQLAAVETLGSTTVILTDKTGTLTENRMTVVELRLADGRVSVGGSGLETTGGFRRRDSGVDVSADPVLEEAIRTGVLCNNATLERREDAEPEVTGDPTEVALLVLGEKAGLSPEALTEEWPEKREIAFDPDTKRMATLHEREGRIVAAIKGAPEAIVELCASVRHSGAGASALDAEARRAWLASAAEMAASGQRVLALATAEVSSAEAFGFEDLTLLGLVGFFDPPRERVRAALEACQAAGIRVVMVTGDHGATAWNVAEAVGLVKPDPEEPMAVVDGRTIAPIGELSTEHEERLLEATVIARASPRQKLDLIELYQRRGAVVAMTGDGVNDAPALKKADIGVAMGLRGTQVAREAADMVLRDDELGTIVSAVAQGRAIFANIRKFVVYLMSCNVSEIIAVSLGVAAQGPMPILPLQILFLNLVTDVFPALAIGVGEGSPALMKDPPRDPREPILTRRSWRAIFVLGTAIALAVMASLWVALQVLGLSESQSTTVAFLTLAMAQMWHVFSMRNVGSGWVVNELTRNPWIWGALLLCGALLAIAVHWPLLSSTLSLSAPGLRGWGSATVFSLLPLLVGQLSLIPSVGRLLGEDRKRWPSLSTQGD